MIKQLLTHPLTRGMDINSPETTVIRKRIIQEKPFLKKLYKDWYKSVTITLPSTELEQILELGTGAGFLKQYIPSLITSDLFRVEGVDVLLDGRNLPFRYASLQSIVMINVLHHIADTRAFFKEAARCVQPRGIVAMIEPWVTPWSRLVYTRFHDEPFQPESMNWDITDAGPLSSANGALPWIIFHRDRGQFEHEFPEWTIIDILPITPFLYIVSGGVSLRNLIPGWTFELLHLIENSFTPWMTSIAMFARIVLMRNASTTNNSNPIDTPAI